MRIAVIADTHGKLPAVILRELEHADEVWHLGDVCDPGLLVPIEALGKPLQVVRGNTDVYPHWPEFLKLKRGGKNFFLIHIPPTKPIGTDFVLHGHTHVPRDEVIDGVRFLNPGTIGKPNHGAPTSFAWLMIDEKSEAISWKIVELASLAP